MPDKTPAVMGILLSLLFVLLVYPVTKLHWVQQQQNARKHAALALLVLAAAVSAFGWVVWPERKYLDLTEGQKSKFIEILEKTPMQTRVVLGCAANENVCASVYQFIELFQRSGWKVRGNQVERGFLTKPQFGILILVYGTGKIPDPDDPKYGLWTKVINPQRDAIMDALESIGLKVHKTMVDNKLQEGELEVIFGPKGQ